jgi:adenine-specific DNA methylase
MIGDYPKRLIEVDLPIARISAHARREKSIRHGHISTLHIWWARRPLAACRAVILASLWPDPVDLTDWLREGEEVPAPRGAKPGEGVLIRPGIFLAEARERMARWAQIGLGKASADSASRLVAIQRSSTVLDDPAELRTALLDFIADFANWDNSTVREYLDTSRALTQAAHEALGGAPGTRPLVVDPFAGGGSIPLEALRVGADAFASDLNPVAVLLNKVVLEYIPKYGQRLADEVRKWGEWIKKQAEKELSAFYPKDRDGAMPIAYLWARTIQCEGPRCGAEVPLVRSLWVANKSNRCIALQLVPKTKDKRVDFQIIVKQRGEWVDQDDPKAGIESPKFEGTAKRGAATCPCCGYTTPVARVREQLKARRGGAADARLMCVVTTRANKQGRFYHTPSEKDLLAAKMSAKALESKRQRMDAEMNPIPNEKISLNEIRRISVPIYGMTTWADLFTPRQLLALTTLSELIQTVGRRLTTESDKELAAAVQTCLSLNFSRVADLGNSLCGWKLDVQCPTHLFARQAVPMVWDFSESVCLSESSGSWHVMTERFSDTLAAIGSDWDWGVAQEASAASHPMPSDSADAFITDPPYYDAVPYAHLSDFFYVWHRRNLFGLHPELFKEPLVPKGEEIVVDRPHELSDSTHDVAYYERELTKAFGEGRRVLRPDGIGTIVFASKTTASWEAILKAVVSAGWIITGSWPIDTEMDTRVAAQGQARLASSVHLVCRPRKLPNGPVRTDESGEWRDVLQELPRRIHEWMPRLAEEGVVGADAIFACLGPALEIFSRYSRVEKASGEAVTLKEYLEQVWAAVAKEALTMVFAGADATGFEADARLTAMWLWTLNSGNSAAANGENAEEDEADDESEGGAKKAKTTGFVLEYDAARKIAQGLGASLEDLGSLVEVAGETARLLPVGERTRYLFGKESGPGAEAGRVRKKKPRQGSLFEELELSEAAAGLVGGDVQGPRAGSTVLDRVHQSMILFAAGRGEALKRFLVEDGVGKDGRFWRLADALAALYPRGTDERRWVEGVLARKKGLGF